MTEKTGTQILGGLSGLIVAALIIATFSTVGCQSNSKPDVVKSTDLRYFQDSRTTLCFAATNSYHDGWQITSITNVPCTPAVLKIINPEGIQ